MAAPSPGPCVCEPAISKDGFAYNEWVARYFSDCVWSPKEVASFAIGTSSIGFWLCCQAPQFIKNCRTGNADALSIFFLSQWLLGDGLNLIGAIMTHQLTTEIMTAVLFIIMDVCILGQWLLLHFRNRGRSLSGYERIPSQTAAGGGADLESLSRSTSPSSSPGASSAATGPGGLDVVISGGEGPNESSSSSSSSSSTSTASAAATASYSAPSATRARGTSLGKQGKLLSAFAAAVLLYGSGSAMLPTMLAMEEGQVVVPAGPAAMSLVVPPSPFASIHGRRRHLLADLGPGMAKDDVADTASGKGGVAKKDKPAICNDKSKKESPYVHDLGVVLGWISAGVYLTSRLPQIAKNFRRRSVEGLSMMMFFCAVMGNLTYAMGIFLRSTAPEALAEAAPWILGSVGTLAMDFTILTQVRLLAAARARVWV